MNERIWMDPRTDSEELRAIVRQAHPNAQIMGRPPRQRREKMANMARKESAGVYQIGIYTVTRKGKRWEAFATGALGEYRKEFPTLKAAHLELTGEAMVRR